MNLILRGFPQRNSLSINRGPLLRPTPNCRGVLSPTSPQKEKNSNPFSSPKPFVYNRKEVREVRKGEFHGIRNGIDLGTSYILVYAKGKGIVLKKEPSAIKIQIKSAQ